MGAVLRIDVRTTAEGVTVAVATDQAPRPPKLTPRQTEVARLMVSTGLSIKEIAAELGISEGSVRTHSTAIYRALGVRSRPELVTKLRKLGVV